MNLLPNNKKLLNDSVKNIPKYNIQYKNKLSFLIFVKDPELYLLGCIPFIHNPFYRKHIYVPVFGGCHAVIYSRQAREKLIELNKNCKAYASSTPGSQSTIIFFML